MKIFIVSSIVALLTVVALDMVEGNHSPNNKAHGKLSHARTATGKLSHALGSHSHVRDDGDENSDENSDENGDVVINNSTNEIYDELISCAKEYGANDYDLETFLEPGKEIAPHLFECFAGCYYQSINFTTDGEFNKDIFAVFIADITGDEKEVVMKDADDCEADLAEFTDFCKRGEVIDTCIKKSIPIYEMSG